VSARYRKDEQALGQLTRRSARSPRSALEIVTTVINSGALPFLPYEDLQAEVLGGVPELPQSSRDKRGAKR
jgi:hypothetical protein